MPSKYNIGEQDYLNVYNICFTQNVKRKYGFLYLLSNGQRNLSSIVEFQLWHIPLIKLFWYVYVYIASSRLIGHLSLPIWKGLS